MREEYTRDRDMERRRVGTERFERAEAEKIEAERQADAEEA